MMFRTSRRVMRNRSIAIARFTLLVSVVSLGPIGCGPIGPIPGGRLSGEIGAPSVSDWSFAAEIENAQLETRPSDPHSVNTWFVALGPRLYVPTSMILGPKDPTERSWTAHVARSPDVRIRLGSSVFERVAVRVENADEYERARAALEKKYDLDPAERDPERQVWIFRLDAPLVVNVLSRLDEHR